MSYDPSDDYPRYSENTIVCVQCGGGAGKFYPAKTYGDPGNCSPAEDTVEFSDEDGHSFCSQECADEYLQEHADEEIEDESESA